MPDGARGEPRIHALWTLGGVPGEHRSDSLSLVGPKVHRTFGWPSSPYRNLDKEAAEGITKRYDDFCSHYEMLASR